MDIAISYHPAGQEVVRRGELRKQVRKTIEANYSVGVRVFALTALLVRTIIQPLSKGKSQEEI
jgi:hypothetical protein